MMDHEYIVICGFNRSKVGQIIAVVASFISASLIYILLKSAELLEYYQITSSLPPSLFSLVSAGFVYFVLYKWFNARLWKKPNFGNYLRVPNLSGNWMLNGETLSGEKYKWKGELKIVQSWDRVRIYLQTKNSRSDSITASIIYDEGIGYRLLYNYRNQPRLGELNLNNHIGFAEFVFTEDLHEAEGEYFNGKGRNTFGKMSIRRVIDG